MNEDTMKWKKILTSAAVTFVAGFAIVVGPELANLSLEEFHSGAVWGLIFTGVRTGLKMLVDMYLVWYANRV